MTFRAVRLFTSCLQIQETRRLVSVKIMLVRQPAESTRVDYYDARAVLSWPRRGFSQTHTTREFAQPLPCLLPVLIIFPFERSAGG